MLSLLSLIIGALISAIAAYLIAGYMEEWLHKRRIWLLEYGPGEYSKEMEDPESRESCRVYLQNVLNQPGLDRDVRFRFVSGFARQNYKLLAEVFQEMIEKKEENQEILDFLSTELRVMGLRSVTYTSLQKFFSYLNSPRLETLASEMIDKERTGRLGRELRAYNQRKRATDLIASTVLLILLSPIMAIIAILLWWDSPGQIIRRIRQLGLNGQSYDHYMFRTFPLYVNHIPSGDPKELARKYEEGFKREYEEGSWFARFLVKWTLHRLPGLINVLSGQMSLVGPTPLSLHEFPYLTTQQGLYDLARHLSVRPGLMGRAQLESFLDPFFSWSDAMRIDEDYLNNLSLKQDLQVIGVAAKAYLHNIWRNLSPSETEDWFLRHIHRQAVSSEA